MAVSRTAILIKMFFNMKTEAVFFDLDDTLIAFDAVSDLIWKMVIDEYAEINPKVKSNVLMGTIKAKSNWYWSDTERHTKGRNNLKETRRKIVQIAFKELNLPSEDAVRLADKYDSERTENIHLFPGVVEVLEVFIKKGVKLVLITNGEGSIQRYKIKKLNLERYFKDIFIEGELGFGKPDKRVFEMALEASGSDRERVVMVGDKLEWDIRGAMGAGIASVWCDYKKEGLPSGCADKPDHIIHDISELPGIVLH